MGVVKGHSHIENAADRTQRERPDVANDMRRAISTRGRVTPVRKNDIERKTGSTCEEAYHQG